VAVAIVLIGLVSYWLLADPFWHCPTSLYPGRFEFVAVRNVDGPAEEDALTAAETFNFTALPVDTTFFPRDYYISRQRLDAYAKESAQFDPWAHCGYRHYVYTANVTWCSTLNFTFTEPWGPFPERNPLTVTANGTVVFPYDLPGWPFANWAAGHWNGTGYAVVTEPQQLNYTDVFLVSMQLDYSYSFGPELECQQVVVDATGLVLCAFWLRLTGPVV